MKNIVKKLMLGAFLSICAVAAQAAPLYLSFSGGNAKGSINGNTFSGASWTFEQNFEKTEFGYHADGGQGAIVGLFEDNSDPFLMMLSYDFSIKDVVFIQGMSTPATIGQIRFDNILVRGNTSGPSFGSIVINDIDLRHTTFFIGSILFDNKEIEFGRDTINLGFSDKSFFADAAAVPEPASLALVGLGLAGLAASRRRKS